jgi:plasmid stability protein
MSQILVRNLKPDAVRGLKKRAARQGRSVQSEVKSIIDQETSVPALDPESARRLAERIAKLVGRPGPATTKLIREARDRGGRP